MSSFKPGNDAGIGAGIGACGTCPGNGAVIDGGTNVGAGAGASVPPIGGNDAGALGNGTGAASPPGIDTGAVGAFRNPNPSGDVTGNGAVPKKQT